MRIFITLSFVESGSTLKNPTRSNWNFSNGLAFLTPSSTRALELIVKEFWKNKSIIESNELLVSYTGFISERKPPGTSFGSSGFGWRKLEKQKQIFLFSNINENLTVDHKDEFHNYSDERPNE